METKHTTPEPRMATTAASVQVSTTEFQAAHGRAPRGSGTWAFFFAGEVEARWFRGTFTEAKSQATRAAAAAHVRSVSVGS